MGTHYSGTWFPCNGKRKALKDSSHGGQHGATLFAHRGKITANGTKSRCPLFTAKGAGNLLLDLDHPQIAFGQIVRKRHRKIVQERKHLLGPFEQGIQEILGIGLFGPTMFLWRGRRLRWGSWRHQNSGALRRIALSEDFKILE